MKNINRALSTLLLLGVTLLGICGCETTQHARWKSRKKERNEPQPTRYEAPFSQLREAPPADPLESNAKVVGEEIPPEPKSDPEIVEPPAYVPGSHAIPTGIAIKDKPGYVLSPYSPDKGLVDVRGFPAGTDVRDPFSGRPMRVPTPIVDPKKGNSPSAPAPVSPVGATETTLSDPGRAPSVN